MRILYIDIETRPIKAYLWGLRKQDVSVDQVIEPHGLLCFAAKWHGERRIAFHRSVRPCGPEYKAMVRAAYDLVCAADAVCHFNGARFDMPRLAQEFLLQGLPPPPPIPQIDLWRVVTRQFDMTSSKLAFVGPYLGIGSKVKHEGWQLWIDCLAGDAAAWARMEKYCRGDVALLEPLYTKLQPWIDGHPNHGLFTTGADPVCPNCGSTKLQSRGVQRALTLAYKRYQCTACGRWSRARFASKTDAKVSVR